MRYFGLRFATIAATMAIAACQSYTDESQGFRASLWANHTDEALKKIESSSLAKDSANRVLYHMEKGSVLYQAGRYREAANEWDKAVRRIEELYSVSISRQAGGYLVSETLTDYEGEAHEKVLLPVFSALAYLSAGELNEAAVEARRTARVLEEINKETEGKALYERDGFGHYLAGMIFEAKREWDSAIIEYRRALEASEENSKWIKKVRADVFVEALARVAEMRNRRDILEKLRKDHPGARWGKMPNPETEAEIVAVVEAGKSPFKRSQDQLVPTGDGFIRLAFPKFEPQYYISSGAKLDVDGVGSERLEAMQDIGSITLQAWEDHKAKYIAKMAARAIAKGTGVAVARRNFGVLGGLAASVAVSATEVADTRGWTTLPDLILVSRMTVPAGKDLVVRLTPDSGKPLQTTVRLRPGEKKIIRLRTFE